MTEKMTVRSIFIEAVVLLNFMLTVVDQTINKDLQTREVLKFTEEVSSFQSEYNLILQKPASYNETL